MLTLIPKISQTNGDIAYPPGTPGRWIQVGQQKGQGPLLLGLKPPVSLCLLSWGDRRERAPPSHPSWTSACRGPDMDQMCLRFCLSRCITCAGLYTGLLRWEVAPGNLPGPLCVGKLGIRDPLWGEPGDFLTCVEALAPHSGLPGPRRNQWGPTCHAHSHAKQYMPVASIRAFLWFACRGG